MATSDPGNLSPSPLNEAFPQSYPGYFRDVIDDTARGKPVTAVTALSRMDCLTCPIFQTQLRLDDYPYLKPAEVVARLTRSPVTLSPRACLVTKMFMLPLSPRLKVLVEGGGEHEFVCPAFDWLASDRWCAVAPDRLLPS